jgi:hypothetical protein
MVKNTSIKAMANDFQLLLNTRMTRKEFLIRMGILVFVISGIASMSQKVKAITTTPPKVKPIPKKTFGSGAYGI